jgi:hypothetical protein
MMMSFAALTFTALTTFAFTAFTTLAFTAFAFTALTTFTATTTRYKQLFLERKFTHFAISIFFGLPQSQNEPAAAACVDHGYIQGNAARQRVSI